MEMDHTKINKSNADDKCHGLWGDTNWMTHLYNGSIVGYDWSAGGTPWQAHCINDKHIGCFQLGNSQYFFKTPNKLFGEQITWK